MKRYAYIISFLLLAGTVLSSNGGIYMCQAADEEAEMKTAIPYASVDGTDASYLEGTLTYEGITSKVAIDVTEEYGAGQIYISFNDLEYYLEEYTYGISDAYYIPGDEISYAVVASNYDNDWVITHLFKITDTEIEYLNNVTMSITDINICDESIFVNGSTRANIFGTYNRDISAEIRDDRITIIDAPYYELETEMELTTAVPITVNTYMAEEGTESVLLEKGTVLQPIAINVENSEFIVSNNDDYYAIPFEEKYVTDEDGYTYLESRTINGISEYDVFEFLPYAG